MVQKQKTSEKAYNTVNVNESEACASTNASAMNTSYLGNPFLC